MTNPQPIDQPNESSTAPAPSPGAPGRRQSGQRCRVRVGSADSVLAVVPHLLGFHPAESLVVLGVGGPHDRIRLAFRYDLPDPPEAELAADIAEHAASVLSRQSLNVAIAIGYGPGRTVTPVVDALAPALLEAGVRVHDVLRVEDGRYFSYVCTDPRCCPPEGVPFDPAGHPAAAALAAAGLTVRSGRAELASMLAPAAGQAEPMRRAMDNARLRATQMMQDALDGNSAHDVLEPIADAGRRSVRLAVAKYRRGEHLTDHDEIAWLGMTLTDLRVRDDAWARMDPEFNEDHQRLWIDLIQHLPEQYVPPPASLLAFTAWQSGDGALASIAIERALAADPEYSMALLIGEAVQSGLPPSAARLPMTPKQVAASYARQRSAVRKSRRGAPDSGGAGAMSGRPPQRQEQK